MAWQQWLIRFSNGVWLLAVGLLVLLAVYVALGRNLMPRISFYQAEIEQSLQETLGVPVAIGSVGGGWDGLDPVVLLKDVELSSSSPDRDAPAFAMRNFRLRLNVWESLRRQKLIFQDVYAAGIALKLRQTTDGRWELEGFESPPDTERSNWEAIRQYLEQPNLDVAEVNVTLVNHAGEASLWRLPRLHMRDLGNGYEASGSVLQPGADERFLQFSLKGKGNPFGGSFDGQVYLDWLSGPFLDPFLAAYNLSGVRVSHVDAGGHAWLTFRDGALSASQGDLHLDALQWRNDALTIAPIEDLDVRFRFQRDATGWQLRADQLDFAWRGERWKPSNLTVRHQSQPDANTKSDIVARMDRLPLAMMSELAQATQLLPLEGVDELAGRGLKGELQNLELRVPLEDRDAPLFELKANLQDVRVEAYRSAPELAGLTGFLSMTEQSGRVEFRSSTFAMNFPELFEQGWQFAQGEGVVAWKLLNGAVEVNGKGISVVFPDGQGGLHGGFHLLVGDDTAPDLIEDHLALSLGFRNVAHTQVPAYLPCRLIERAICDWVTENLKGGIVGEGSYLYNGSIESDSGIDEDHVSRLFLRLDQGVLGFHPDWPNAENLSATLLLDGSALDVAIAQAVVGPSEIRDARVWIPPVEKGKPEVNVSVQADLTPEQVNYWLKQSPLQAQTGDLIREWTLGGAYQADVRLQVPLAEAPLRAQVTATTGNGYLVVPTGQLELKRIRGALRYDSLKGLFAAGMRAEHLGRPLLIDLSSQLWKEDHKTVMVRAKGAIALSNLYQWQDLDPLPGVEGETAYLANVLIETGLSAPQVTVDLQTDLEGIVSEWPEPLRKDAQEKIGLRYVQQFSSSGQGSEAQIAFGDQLKAKLRFDDGKYRRGVVAFNHDDLDSGFDGTLVRGRLDRIDSDAWRAFLQSRQSADREQEQSLPALQLDLQIGQLHAMERDIEDVRLRLERQEQSWRVSLHNDRQISGSIQIPDADTLPVISRFDYLRLPSVDEKQIQSSLSPTTIPLLDLQVKDLELGSQNYGGWSFVTERREHGTVFKDVVGEVAGATIMGRLSWLQDPETRQNTTIVTGTVKGGAVETFLEHWGKASSVTSKRMDLEVGLVWPAAPMDFEIAKASGSISLKMEDGVFRETSRSADAVRIFGVLNMESITRRLLLDFTDLYEKGVSYDLMEGKASLSYGVMKFEQPLAIKGPSSAFKITGRADLNDENLDMEMVTILPVTKNLPLAAVLIGAPQVGGALFIIDRLLGDPLSRLTSVTYTLKGNFKEPKVEIKNVFDTKTTPKASEARQDPRE